MNQQRILLFVVLVLAPVFLATSAFSQTPSPGFRLICPLNGTDTHLVDNVGAVVHTWTGPISGRACYVLEDGSLLRHYQNGTLSGVGGPLGGGVQRVALDGTVLWDYQYNSSGNLTHHDIEPMPNGNVLLVAWETLTAAQAIAAGRNPATIQGNIFRPDHVVEIQPTGPLSGTIVWEWHVIDHVIQDIDPSQGNFGVVADHPERININFPNSPNGSNDWNHVNGVDYDPVNDYVMISSRSNSEIWVIDHGTTTAEAAGHTGGARGVGGDLVYRWGNPRAYDSGTPADQTLFNQHGSNFIPPGYPGAGNILLFNNNISGGSQVNELVPPQDASGNFILTGNTYGPVAPLWAYSAANFSSNVLSSARRLPNGNTLVCSGSQGFVFEVTPAGQQVTGYHFTGAGGGPFASDNVFHSLYVERSLWADRSTLSAAAGGSVGFDLITGSPHNGEVHLLVGSASGTSPGLGIGALTLPLNPDDYTVFAFNNANTALLGQTLGVLNPLGRATSTFNLPAGFLPASLVGLHLDHAFLLVDSGIVTHVSNAEGLTFVN